MPGVRITSNYFSSGSRLYGAGSSDLSAIVRGLAIDNARNKLAVSTVADLTDNSTGTAAASFVDMVVPTTAFDATSAGGSLLTDSNTAFGKIENAGRVLVNSMNNIRARLGLSMMSAASGTEASANTIPAQDLSVTTSSGTSAIDFATGRAALLVVKSNIRKLVRGFNEILSAAGMTPLSQAFTGSVGSDLVLADVVNASASATGASSISKTVMDAFLAASAANLATLARKWNTTMNQTGFSDLTDSTGGTAAAGLAANTIPALAAGAATTSAPKAGFDTALAVTETNLSEICTRMNALRSYYGLSEYTDSTGATVDGTLAAMTVALTAVDGSTGTDAINGTDGRARMTTIHNALSSLAVGINDLVPYFGVTALTDAVAGTASTTIANLAATGAGIGEDTVPGGTLLDSAVDAWLVINRNNVATLAAKLNAMTGSGVPDKPLSVVAV